MIIWESLRTMHHEVNLSSNFGDVLTAFGFLAAVIDPGCISIFRHSSGTTNHFKNILFLGWDFRLIFTLYPSPQYSASFPVSQSPR